MQCALPQIKKMANHLINMGAKRGGGVEASL